MVWLCSPAPSGLRDDGSASLTACRIHGYLFVNKVAGNFHITVGKYVCASWEKGVKVCACLVSVSPQTGSLSHRSIPHPRGHAHLAALISHDSKVPYFLMKISLEQTHQSSLCPLRVVGLLLLQCLFCSYLHSDKCGWSQRCLRWFHDEVHFFFFWYTRVNCQYLFNNDSRVDWVLQHTTSRTGLTICPLEKLFLGSSAL